MSLSTLHTTARAGQRQPLDQADGLRRLFAGSRPRFVAVASNPHVAFSGVLVERLASAFNLLRRHVLVVDAAESAPPPNELAVLDLAACIEPLGRDVSYIAARGLPLRHVDARGSSAGLLQRLADAAPQAEVVVVHASAAELSRLFTGRAVRPLLLAADQPTSVTHAYGAMKLLAQRNGLMSYDLLLAAAPQSPRRERIAEQIASCGDRFLGTALRDWTDVDPASDAASPLPAPLVRMAHAQLHDTHDDLDDAHFAPAPAAARRN